MDILYLGTNNNFGNPIVEIEAVKTKTLYKYETTEYVSRVFEEKYKGSKGGFSSLNYLKKNSKLVGIL